MPTRITLRQTAPSQVTPRFRRNATFSADLSMHEEDAIEQAAAAVTPRARDKRSIVGFRSSILRELSVRADDPDGEQDDEERVRVSSEDIRASSRLLGYMFCMIAAFVMLVSVIQYKRKDVASVNIDNDKYYSTTQGLVYRWKLWGAIYIAAIGGGVCALTVIAHFDTVCFPQFWVVCFRDGSLAERNLIFAMLVFWAAGVHICTSSLSVGENQANVFFTTWIAFGSIALNYGVWRESAGLPSMADKIMNSHNRETTYNWLWTALFSSVFAGSATDIFYNRADIELRFGGKILTLSDRDWYFILSAVWAEVVLCILAVFLNEWFPESPQCPCGRQRQGGGIFRCIFGWRQIEGLVILIWAAGKFYVILEYTAVGGLINGLSNAYFGAWGSFFNSVFCFGTWLKENKNIDFFVRESNEEEADESAES